MKMNEVEGCRGARQREEGEKEEEMQGGRDWILKEACDERRISAKKH